MDMTRALLVSGAKSVIASEWSVADDPTRALMIDFYRRYLGHESKSAALRNAQLDLLRRLRAGSVKISSPAGELTLPEDPSFWAAFVLLGRP